MDAREIVILRHLTDGHDNFSDVPSSLHLLMGLDDTVPVIDLGTNEQT